MLAVSEIKIGNAYAGKDPTWDWRYIRFFIHTRRGIYVEWDRDGMEYRNANMRGRCKIETFAKWACVNYGPHESRCIH
jgi:hypothetical protein